MVSPLVKLEVRLKMGINGTLYSWGGLKGGRNKYSEDHSITHDIKGDA